MTISWIREVCKHARIITPQKSLKTCETTEIGIQAFPLRFAGEEKIFPLRPLKNWGSEWSSQVEIFIFSELGFYGKIKFKIHGYSFVKSGL